MKRLVFSLFLLIIMPVQALEECKWGSQPWKPRWANQTTDDIRDDLCCGSYCAQQTTNIVESKEYDKCCTCQSSTTWEGTETELYIEYISVLGKSVVFSDKPYNKSKVYKIVFTNEQMTEFPSNLCNWDKDSSIVNHYSKYFEDIKPFWDSITTIDFRNNKIRHVPDINCLYRLDSLNLSNNQLTTISNTSFTNLTRLRFIEFAGNIINKIDPKIFTSPSLNLFSVDLSHNLMEKLDVSNMISLYPFCDINFDNNKITELENQLNFTLSTNTTYGPGFVSLKENLFQSWPDFKELFHLNELSEIGKLFGFGFDFRGIPIICDCNLEPFLSLAEDIVGAVWRDYHNVTCTGPPKYNGTPVVNVPLSELICNMTAENCKKECCPKECTCTDKPHENTLYVDCSNQGLKEFPILPKSKFSKYLFLDLSKNNIEYIDNMTYLANISVLNISNNNLKEIDNEIASLLENASYIDLSNNPLLRELPQMMQYHNVCARNMKHLTIECGCDSLWIEQWLSSKSCVTSKQLFNCTTPEVGIRPALDFSSTDVNCFDPGFLFLRETLIAALILLLIILGSLMYYLRFEILIIFLRLRQKKGNVITPLQPYDVFISFNDSDELVTGWINKFLEPNLVKTGYNVFNPSRDIAYGAERDAEVISTLSNTRNFLLVLTDSYLTEPVDGQRSWTENEWKYGWNQFKSDRSKNIVLVNFDHASSFDVEHRQIRAFLRVGINVQFKNQNRNIMDEIHRKLGNPFPVIESKYDCNRKQVFPKDLFLAKTEQEYQPDLKPNKQNLKIPLHVRSEKTCIYRKCEACKIKEKQRQETLKTKHLPPVFKIYIPEPDQQI